MLFRQDSITSELTERSFFCSELIAKIYKELGLLNTKTPSSKFLPTDLSVVASKPVTLSGENQLLDDQMVVF